MTLIPKSEFPRIFRVRQKFDAPTCSDIKNTVVAELERLQLSGKVAAGESVAITAGSRGISNIAEIIQAIAQFFLDLKAEPFIVPSMGSHGGGTSAGQRQVLESYGITESFCGCPIKDSMETVTIGEAAEGFPIYFDKSSSEADHVVVCGRVKPHTNFSGDIQSGLMKMMMIGLGKKDGAALYHRAIHQHGFPQIIRSVAPKVVEHASILAGVAIVENAKDETALIEAVLPEDFQSRETELLKQARQWMPSLPFDELDVLLIDKIGKNISGTGMDTNVIGRKHSEHGPPNIKRLVVRDLTEETHGNATGIGFAELCLSRVIEKMNRETTVLNCLTALDIDAAKIPVNFSTDEEAIATALSTLGLRPPNESRLMWIHNTGELGEVVCSEALRPEVDASPSLEAISELVELPLGAAGMLPDDFFG